MREGRGEERDRGKGEEEWGEELGMEGELSPSLLTNLLSCYDIWEHGEEEGKEVEEQEGRSRKMGEEGRNKGGAGE